MLGHALVSLAIVIGSLVALAPTFGMRVQREPLANVAIVPSQLSPTGRLAYWRPSPGDEQELWVADLEGHRRFPIATMPKKTDPELTRWSPDGDSVAWHADGEVHVVRLDRTRATVSVPEDLRESRWRPVVLEWSPDSGRLAATLRPAGGMGNEADVFLAELDRTATTWRRLTRTGDSLVSQWLDDGKLLVETTSATVGVLSIGGREPMRPISAMSLVSPRIGPDGRIWAFGGRRAGQGLFSGPVAAGTVWSMTVDGDDVRRMSSVERDQGRLHAFLPDGRPLIGVPGAIFVVGDEAVLFPWRTGGVRRVVVAQDGRHTVALTETRILRAHVVRIPRSLGSLADTSDATSVVLDGVRAPDVWFPSRPIPLARSGRTAGPREQLLFTLARTLWRLGPDGDIRPVLANAADQWGNASAVSADGRVIAASTNVRRTSDGRYEPHTVIVDTDGAWRTSLSGYAPPGAWSHDGSRLLLSRSDGGTGRWWLDEVETETWATVARYERGRGAFTAVGLALVGEGRPHPAAGQSGWARVGQPLEVVTATGRRRITDADTLVRHPLAVDLLSARGPDSDLLPAITDVRPSPSGSHALVSLALVGADGGHRSGLQLLIDASTGEPLAPIRAPAGYGFWDHPAWSPSAEMLAVTRTQVGSRSSAETATAVVMDRSGRAVLERAGRFAGWSHDGQRVYLARPEGLFEMRLDGDGETRVSALGVAPVTATRP